LKLFFDSSVLVPVFYADHPQHTSSTKLFLDAGKDDFCAFRTLGEVYATLTGLPLRPRITAPEGISIVKQIRERLTLITLSEQEYVSTLELASSGTIVGPAAYDALIAHCALKANRRSGIQLESGPGTYLELSCLMWEYNNKLGDRPATRLW
jgi:predicted nucleic acid-binding protein